MDIDCYLAFLSGSQAFAKLPYQNINRQVIELNQRPSPLELYFQAFAKFDMNEAQFCQSKIRVPVAYWWSEPERMGYKTAKQMRS